MPNYADVDSKYTININLQMNYWPVELQTFQNLHAVYLLETMHEKARKPPVLYVCAVWYVTITQIFTETVTGIHMAATPWVTGGAWMACMCGNICTKDAFERMYPILKDMCLFYEDFLIEVDGKLVTCPSVSPENRYILPDGYDTRFV